MCRPERIALVAALALLVVAVPAAGGAQGGELRIRSQHHENGAVYIEGAYQYVRIRREGGRVVDTFRIGERMRRFRLRPGTYRVSSWTRSCAGSCATLDPPRDHCRGSFRVRAGRYVTATIHTAVGEDCWITNP